MESDAIETLGPILAFDTSAAHCAAALFLEGDVYCVSENMDRGQAEALMPILDELLAGQGLGYQDLARLAVGVGPGNFTGIRIAVSAARGLAMGLGVPAIGVTGFEAVLHGQDADLVAIPAPRDMAYLKDREHPPRLVNRADVPARALWPGEPKCLARAIALIAAEAGLDRTSTLPAPLYIRPADAAPPREAAPVILDDPS